MALASLVDAGADVAEVSDALSQLPVEGWALEAEKVQRGGLMGTHLKVGLAAVNQDEDRDWADVQRLLQSAVGLPARALQRAQRVFSLLAEAEGRLHGLPPERAHFHEVGALDAIIDVVGTCVALDLLGIGAVYASPVAVGAGTVRAAHGTLPNPAPAVLELLRGAPLRGVDQELELTTPTGAALLAALAEGYGPLPPMKVARTGYGAGSRDLPGTANMLQVVVGEMSPPPAPVAPGEPGPSPGLGEAQSLVVLEANLDDVTGETLGHAVAALLEAGAMDSWVAPVVGKKGRPAHVLSALCAPGAAPALAELVARQTGALGLRSYPVTRWALGRTVREVEVGGHAVRVKVGPYRAKAEHDDCVAVAGLLGLPVAEVARRAEQAASGAGVGIA